jgi:hypothetical protein
MTTPRPANLTAVLLALLLSTLVGCATTTNGAMGTVPVVSVPAASVPAASVPAASAPAASVPANSPPVVPAPIISGVLDELSPDDDLAFNPPAPENVRAGQVTAAGAELVWDAPSPVAVPHGYSDRVVAFRIYRSSDDELELRPLAMTAELSFVDRSVESGRTYHYAVASIRELNVEGTRSYPTDTISLP